MTVLDRLLPLPSPVRPHTSWAISPLTLAALRAVLSLYCFITVIVVLAKYGSESNGVLARRNFSYFTSLTWWGLAFYFAFAALHSFTLARTGEAALERWPMWLRRVHRLFYSTIVVFPWLVTIVFWGIIYSPDEWDDTFDVWQDASQHALNSIFAFSEILLPAAEPIPFGHFLWLLIICALYIAVAYITVATEGIYVYEFLDDRKEGGRGRVAAYAFGILAAIVVIMLIVKGLGHLRVWVTERKMHKEPKLARYRNQRHRDMEGAEMMEK